jgi:epoxyqueuosine reductase QueG
MEVHVREEGLFGIYLNIKFILTYCDKQISTARLFSPAADHTTICQAVCPWENKRFLKYYFKELHNAKG